jgi:fumarylacetoacetase
VVTLNETHDPTLSSWLESANRPGGDFPIQNLPFGVFRRAGTDEPFRAGVAIGDEILDMAAARTAGAFAGDAERAAAAADAPDLNALMALGAPAWSALRLALSRALRHGSLHAEALGGCLVAQAEAEFALPARIGDYTDFYSSIHHATRVGRLFRPDNPLLPNYKWLPIGYHGRASSIAVSEQHFHRPLGQTLPAGREKPVFGPSTRLDFELELGVFIGPGNAIGSRIPIEQAESHVFGLCLLNDWSARDLQAWESQPLGPFLSKSFATTVSPWIVTLEALAPFRAEWARPENDPAPLPYLDGEANRRQGALDIRLEASLQTARMRTRGESAARVSRTRFRHAYWSIAQMIAHHTVSGCNLKPGDLLGTGTVSGPAHEEGGSLLELTSAGPLSLPGGESRTFLEDGDAVILRGWCEKPGAVRIGFGEAVGRVLPAVSWESGIPC